MKGAVFEGACEIERRAGGAQSQTHHKTDAEHHNSAHLTKNASKPCAITREPATKCPQTPLFISRSPFSGTGMQFAPL